MTERQGKILSAIVKEHVMTSEPVGSKVLTDKHELKMSSATVRNDMKVLEKEGYLTSPHTSAGRLPSDKAYKWYISSLEKLKVNSREKDAVRKKLGSLEDTEKMIKMAANILSDLTYCTALATLSSHDTYFRGIGHMLRNPEFDERSRALNAADLIDHLNEFISELPRVQENVVYIGEDSPYLKKAHCSLIVAPYKTQDRQGIIGLLGPSRMSYDRNISLLDLITESLNDF